MICVFFDIGDTLVGSEAQWMTGAKPCLSRLNNAGIRLGIISNTGTLTLEELQRRYLPADFDFCYFETELVILSSAFGSDKSQPEIFLHAIAQSGLAASDCVFAGENQAEISMARTVGMRTAWINRFPDDFEDLGRLATGSWSW